MEENNVMNAKDDLTPKVTKPDLTVAFRGAQGISGVTNNGPTRTKQRQTSHDR
jgi:hypothetical protein